MRSTFKILMYLKKGSEKPNGNVPLMCRLTVDGEIKQFSCKMDVPPRLWDVKASRASGKSIEAQKVNRAVDKIRVDVNRRYPAPSIIKERDYFVLNSTSNTPKLLDRLAKYERIYCYLDNDEAGMRTTLDIQQRYGVRVSDQSVNFRFQRAHALHRYLRKKYHNFLGLFLHASLHSR